jgi:hypothetical protein
MVREAETHADEDCRRGEQIDARNELDTLACRQDEVVVDAELTRE